MNSFEELELTFSRFIDFGKVLDKPTRKFLVFYLYSILKGENAKDEIGKNNEENSEFQSSYFSYLKKTLDRIFENQTIIKLAKENESLTTQIINDTIKWIKDTDKKINAKNPFQEEQDRFDTWAYKPTHLYLTDWDNLINYLSIRYDREELDSSFYTQKFKELIPQSKEFVLSKEYDPQAEKKIPLDILIADLLAQWDALLTAKWLAFQAQYLEEASEDFSQKLYQKADDLEKLGKLISPFAMEVGRYWDLSQALWKKTGFEALEKYAAILENETAIQELVDLLGKMREAQIETEEEEYKDVVVYQSKVKDPHLRSEINGTRMSNDLNMVLPSEIALLGNPETEWMFLKKYADSQLLSFQYEGTKTIFNSEEETFSHQHQKKKEKGAFIVCIDTSGSMQGTPSQIAKTLCFAIMKMAAKESRKAYLISFSVGIKKIRLDDIAESLDRIVDFLSMSFDGGTDATPALSETLTLLKENDFKDADVLMVSDFVMYSLREDFIKRMETERQKDTRFHSLAIAQNANAEILEVFDHNWVYNPKEENVIQRIWKDLQTLED